MDNDAFLCRLSNAENSFPTKSIKRNTNKNGHYKRDLPLVVDTETGDCYLDGCLFCGSYDASDLSFHSLNFQSPIQICIENKKATGTILTVPNFQSSRIYGPICYVGEQKIPCMIDLRTKVVKGFIATPGETYLVSYFVQVKDLTETYDIVQKAEATDPEIRGGIGNHVLTQLTNEKTFRVFEPKTGDWIYKAESVQMFDTVSGDLVAVAEKKPENKKDDFYIVLWAGTVGVGMKENGETKEVTRTKEEAWADLFVNTSKKERCSEISEPPMIPTVKVDGGPNPVIASAIVVPISLIGFIASRAVFWQILLVIEAIALFGMLVKTLIDA